MCRTQGATQSCGCLASDSASERQWQGHGELSRHYWNHLKHHAAERGVGFQISIEDAWSAFQKQGGKCAISGVPIEMGRYRPPSSTTVRKWPRLGTASLDRKDSDGDYHKDNVQWVHKEINRMKGKLTDAAFIAMCRTVAQFNQGR